MSHHPSSLAQAQAQTAFTDSNGGKQRRKTCASTSTSSTGYHQEKALRNGEKTRQPKHKTPQFDKATAVIMAQRLAILLADPANQKCADCGSQNPRPTWVSFLEPPTNTTNSHSKSAGSTTCSSGDGSEGPPLDGDQQKRRLGVLCCPTCIQHHYFELGRQRTVIKCLKVPREWSLADIQLLEICQNNTKMNAIYEGHLDKQGTQLKYGNQLLSMDDDHADDDEDERLAKFIKNKYKKRKYFDDDLYQETIQKAHKIYQEERRISELSKRGETQKLPHVIHLDTSTKSNSDTEADTDHDNDSESDEDPPLTNTKTESPGMLKAKKRLSVQLELENSNKAPVITYQRMSMSVRHLQSAPPEAQASGFMEWLDEQLSEFYDCTPITPKEFSMLI